MSYSLCHDSWGKEEHDALKSVIKSNRFTMGEQVKAFERELAEFHRVKHAVMVNSGSSANLLMIGALVESGQLQAGDEVIVPAVSWSTTYFPIHQYGLKMVFVDVEPFGNINTDLVRDAITEKTKAVFTVNLLGFPSDLVELQNICSDNGLILIEDNCESFGASINDTLCGTFGVMGSLSFFFSHHITTMEGGCILTDDDLLADYCRSLRAHGWVRDLQTDHLWCKTEGSFDDAFKFVTPGYCVRPGEMNAAVGRIQLQKWEAQKAQRQINAKHFIEVMRDKDVGTPDWDDGSTWFGFPILVKDRNKLIKRCKQHNIECRPMIAGNFVNQPVVRRLNHRVHGTLPNAERIDKQGLFFGNDGRDLYDDLSLLGTLL